TRIRIPIAFLAAPLAIGAFHHSDTVAVRAGRTVIVASPCFSIGRALGLIFGNMVAQIHQLPSSRANKAQRSFSVSLFSLSITVKDVLSWVIGPPQVSSQTLDSIFL